MSGQGRATIGWVFKRPPDHVPILPCSALFLPPGADGLAMPCSSDSGKPQTNPNPAGSSSQLASGCELRREPEKRRISSPPTLGPCGTTPPDCHPQRQRALPQAAADIRRCVAARRKQRRAARGDADTPHETVPSPKRLGIPMPEKSAAGVQGPSGKATPRPTAPERQLEGPYEVRASSEERRRRGAPCPSSSKAGAATVEMSAHFLAHTHFSNGRHASHSDHR